MKTVRVMLAQINSVVGDFSGNSEKIIDCIKKAKYLNTDILVFPELALCGYPPEDLLLRPNFIQKNSQYLKRIIKATGSVLTIVGSPFLDKGKLFNSVAFLYKGKILGIYKKVNLSKNGVFDEMRYFESGDSVCVLSLSEGLRVGVNICEDLWQAAGGTRIQTLNGLAKIIINNTCSPYQINKLRQRERLLSQRAKELAVYLFYCNLVGGQDELVFDGASMVFDPKGKLIARAKQFAQDLLTVDINISGLTKRRRKSKGRIGLKKIRPKYVKVDHRLQEKKISVSNRIEKIFKPLEEIYAALVLGLKDYVTKNGFKRIVLGISGGIDSGLVAAIAAEAIGANNVLALSLPSRYSSSQTQDDAKKLSKNLGILLRVIPIEPIYKQYLKVLSKPFAKKKSDVTEENLQARIRANLLMAFSNKFGYLVVTTGNKSELSVGYCTLYGDTAGGFALLKDVPKTLVYKLVHFLNKKANKELIPESILKRAPSAELKKGQTDQDSLPPYSTLDPIVDAYIEKDKSLKEITRKGFSQRVVKRVIGMIDRNEYKRRQYAPGPKITPKAHAKDRRMPITNKFTP